MSRKSPFCFLCDFRHLSGFRFGFASALVWAKKGAAARLLMGQYVVLPRYE